MKKVLLSVALLAGAFTVSFAQQKSVKEAKRIANGNNPDFAQAEQLINEALVNDETKDDPATWDVAGFIQKRFIEEEVKKMALKQPYDTIGYYNSAYKLFDYYAKCDELAQIPNEKGKVKNKFRKSNASILEGQRGDLLNGAIHYFNAQDYEKASSFFVKYFELGNLPMLEGKDFSTDENYKLFASYATRAAYFAKDYDAVAKLAPLAIEQTEDGSIALLLLADAYNQKEMEEEYLNTLKQGIELFPEEDNFPGSLVQHYFAKEDIDTALQIALELKEKNPSAYNHFLVGKAYLFKEDYANAKAAYTKSIELNPELAFSYADLGRLNLIEAERIYNDEMPVDIDLSNPEVNAINERVKAEYMEATKNYEKAKELMPENRDLWFMGLRGAYYQLETYFDVDLGDKLKMLELE